MSQKGKTLLKGHTLRFEGGGMASVPEAWYRPNFHRPMLGNAGIASTSRPFGRRTLAGVRDE
jgi:hypothetical protein